MMAEIIIPPIDDCPWCAVQPQPFTERVGCRDEPSRIVGLRCPQCGVQRIVGIPDSDKFDQELAELQHKHRALKLDYPRACMVWGIPKMVERWNWKARQ